MGPEVKQLRHAQDVRDRRAEENATPEDRMRALIAAEVARQLPAAIAAADARVQITGNGCTVSGKFPTLTVTVDPVPPRTFIFTAVCNDDGTITIEGQG